MGRDVTAPPHREVGAPDQISDRGRWQESAPAPAGYDAGVRAPETGANGGDVHTGGIPAGTYSQPEAGPLSHDAQGPARSEFPPPAPGGLEINVGAGGQVNIFEQIPQGFSPPQAAGWEGLGPAAETGPLHDTAFVQPRESEQRGAAERGGETGEPSAMQSRSAQHDQTGDDGGEQQGLGAADAVRQPDRPDGGQSGDGTDDAWVDRTDRGMRSE
jgi:hypothetical protein